MHDRENVRFAEILLLDFGKIFKQATHSSRPVKKCGRNAGRIQSVDFAGGEHFGRAFLEGIALMRISGGREILDFSMRPGFSCPPVKYRTLGIGTLYSSARIPRIHTTAVS